MAARGRYRVTSNVDRNRIITAFEDANTDYLEVADTLGIRHSTARSIVVVYLRDGRRNKLPKGGAKNQKVDDEMRNALEDLLDVNALLTLRQINDDLRARLPNKPYVTTSTIARALDGMLITIKLAEDIPEQRNAPRVIDARADFANWFLHDGVIGHNVYIDETGYNVWTRRSYGRAPRGVPARRVVHGQRGKQVNVTLAISGEVGLVAHTISSETVRRETFEQFLATTVEACRNMFPADEPIYIIYDNARPHVRAQLPPNARNFTIKKLPPYSPFLNPTEMAHSAFKAGVKRTLALPEWQNRFGDRAAADEAGVNLQVWRSLRLQEVAALNIDEVTPAKCMQWYNHSQTYLPRCLGRQIIDG